MSAANESSRDDISIARIPDTEVPTSLIYDGIRWYKLWTRTLDNEIASINGSILHAHSETPPRTVLGISGIIEIGDEPPELIIEEVPLVRLDANQSTILRGRTFSEEAELTALTGLARIIFELYGYI